MSSIITCILKGCDAKFVDSLVSRAINGDDEININTSIDFKANCVVNTYDITECIKIIIKHGDLHDAYIKLQILQREQVDISSKLNFHRELARIYVNQIIQAKYKAKYDAFKFKNAIARGRCNRTCSICLENIDKDVQLTRCNHAFHRSCMSQWQLRNNTCPMCRGDI